MKNGFLKVGIGIWSCISVMCIEVFGLLFLATAMAMPRSNEIDTEFKILFLGLMVLATLSGFALMYMANKARERQELIRPFAVGVAIGITQLFACIKALTELKGMLVTAERFFPLFVKNGLTFAAVLLMLGLIGKKLSDYAQGDASIQ